jgi:ABC-type sulfate transport system permease component
MKSILKKTLGVLICLLFVPTLSVLLELTRQEPNYTEALKISFITMGLVAICTFVGWQVGKLVAWCFR